MTGFDRGCVVSVTLDPAIGHVQRGTRPALVLTTKEFNRLGKVLIAPITQGGEFSRYVCFRPYKTGPSALVIHRSFFSKQPWG